MNNSTLANHSYLIVDDEPNTRTVFEVLLGKVIGSNHVESFSHNNDFLENLSKLSFQPTIFFLDLMMEPHTGYDMLDMLRTSETYKDSIIIAITARVMTHDIEHMQTAGFNGLISKPIVRQIFPELLQRIIAGEEIWYVA